MELLFWNINEFGQVPVGEYARSHAGLTFCICIGVAFVFYLLFRDR
ncbi:hypothetical protein [Anaerotignum sp.]